MNESADLIPALLEKEGLQIRYSCLFKFLIILYMHETMPLYAWNYALMNCSCNKFDIWLFNKKVSLNLLGNNQKILNLIENCQTLEDCSELSDEED